MATDTDIDAALTPVHALLAQVRESGDHAAAVALAWKLEELGAEAAHVRDQLR